MFAKALILLGVFLILIGVVLLMADKISLLGRLPGDILIRKKNVTIYVPVVTTILLSVILTVLLNLFFRK